MINTNSLLKLFKTFTAKLSKKLYQRTTPVIITKPILQPPHSTEAPDDEPGTDEFDELYDNIRKILISRGYSDDIQVDKIGDYIYFRITEGVFFYPDLPVLKESSYPALNTICEILMESYDLIGNIDIGCHTAKITPGPHSNTDFFSWELSSNRALTVLKFFAQQCNLPQAKMSIIGYSCTRPFVEGNSEEYGANRRVEIRISKIAE